MRTFLAMIALGATMISSQALRQHEPGGRRRAGSEDMTRQEAQQKAD